MERIKMINPVPMLKELSVLKLIPLMSIALS